MDRKSCRGFWYRIGIRLKDLGERKRIAWLIRLGYWIKDKA